MCDDGSPSLCATATVNVTISPNTAPSAVADNASTSIASSTTVNVLSNDSDANGGQTITLTAITVAPNQGGIANINDNGTAADPTDDYIDFTPSGLYTGIETFTYQICDNANPVACATAVVSINISTCADGSTPEATPSFAFGSEWKYDDSGLDLGTSWRANLAYVDACWSYGDC
ncbi:MAG: Ig-like domain-containing protein [Chitinophagales bacterium]